MVSLSLTSMVDMFAILVIFLLVSSSTVSQWIQVAHKIELPKAKFVDAPKKAATIQISPEGIFVEEDRLAPGKVREYLSRLDKSDGYINIVAHTKIAFGVVKKVIAECQAAGFHDINLAVQPRGK
jgi:biopolymer transport protein ExbD